MARDTTNETAISGMDDLVAYFESGCKPVDQWRIGTEHEKFPFHSETNRPVAYEGEKSIHQILVDLQEKLGWEPIMDEGNIIGLVEPTGHGAISLEPGGQFELSGAPLVNVHQTCREVNIHLAQLHEVSRPLGIRFLGMGASPKWSLAQTPVMPKSRYKIMTNYMPKVGHEGLDMMYRTSTIQVNLDFASEADMRRKMQISMKLQPLATALFASSPFTDGKPNGMLSWRANIWKDTDNARSGILDFAFSDQFGFADYAEWALDIPMYFVLRDGRYYDATTITFRQFLNGKTPEGLDKTTPNIGDWINHLSTLFPDVRLKTFLEMRGADGGPWRRICALPALWVGLLYDEQALDAAEQMTRDWTYREVLEMRNQVPFNALQTEFRQTTLQNLGRQMLEISRMGLKNRHQTSAMGNDETHFLDPLDEIVLSGRNDAQHMLSQYHTVWGNSVEPAFYEYAY